MDHSTTDMLGPLPCPRCGEPLGGPDAGAEVERSGRPCDGLQGCGGAWYSHHTFELLKKQAQDAGQLNADADFTPQSASPGPTGAPKVDCPECAAPMAQRHFRFEGRATPIIIDDCQAHGIWFDAEELDAALQVVRAHAQALARHRHGDIAATAPPQPTSQDPQDTPLEDGPRGPLISGEKSGRKGADVAEAVGAEVVETFADFALYVILAAIFE